MFKKKAKVMMQTGESVKDIILYWLPEFISGAILFSVPPLLDAYLISSLKSTSTYGTLAVATSVLHALTKLAESIPVASIAIIGRHNGAQEYPRCGKDLGDTFWTTTIIGLIQFLLIFWGAAYIYRWIGVPEKMVSIGVPYLQLRSLGIFLVFICLSFIGFMRGVKNTKIPMLINVVGITTFALFDYCLVLGKLGFPKFGLTGSSIASIIQYSVMIAIAVFYVTTKIDYKKYFEKVFFRHFNKKRALNLLRLSWQIMVDKGSLALSYVWLSKMIAPMGKYAIASYDIVKNLERAAILPAVGFAQVITFLVSNRLGAKDPVGAKSNIKKVMILTAITLSITLAALCINADYLASLFDPQNKYSFIAAGSLTVISVLVILDFVQLILAGSLRGAGDVKTVMWTRFLSCTLFFFPISYIASILPIENQTIKFTLIYSAFYLNTGIMGLVFLKRIRGKAWQQKKV